MACNEASLMYLHYWVCRSVCNPCQTVVIRILTPGCVCPGGEEMARELMAITGLPAQELVHLARSAFVAHNRATSAATALRMRVFESDGVTPDSIGIGLAGMYPQSVTGQLVVCIIPDRAL